LDTEVLDVQSSPNATTTGDGFSTNLLIGIVVGVVGAVTIIMFIIVVVVVQVRRSSK